MTSTVPPGRGRYPGTSCLATISLSLWDKSHTPIEAAHNDLRGVPGDAPGTLCQATIGVVPTGRAARHFATASG